MSTRKRFDDFVKRLRDAISRVKPLTPECVTAAKATTEQEVSGGVDRELIDKRCETCGAQCHVQPVRVETPEESVEESKSELLAALATTLRHRVSKTSQYDAFVGEGDREGLVESALLLAAELLGAPAEPAELAVVQGTVSSMGLSSSSSRMCWMRVKLDQDGRGESVARFLVSRESGEKLSIGDYVKIRLVPG